MRLSYLLLFGFFLGLSVLMYWPSLNGEFIMDDWGYITQNWAVTQSASPWRFWSTLHQPDYWPLSYSSYWLLYRAFGTESLPYHLVNLVLHCLNAVLVFALAKDLKIRWPFWAALLFLVHPQQVQSVAWIVQLKTLLATGLALGSLILYRRYLSERRAWFYIFSFFFFGFALLAKTSVIFLPFALILIAWPVSIKSSMKLLPFFMLGIFGGGLTVYVNDLNFLDRSTEVFNLGVEQKLALMIQSLFFYLKTFLFPTSFSYLYPLRIPELNLTAVLLLIGLAGLLIFLLKKSSEPKPHQGASYFLTYLVLLFPCLGLVAIPNMKLSLVSDHWAYFPNIFLCLFLAAAIPMRDRLGFRILLLVPLIALSILSFHHAKTFASEKAFWKRSIEANPDSAIGYYNLGTVFAKKDEVTPSIEAYRRAVQLDPKHDRAWFNLGRGYLIEKQFEKAEESFNQAIGLNPKLISAYIGLAQVYEAVGSLEMTKQILIRGLEANPGNQELITRIRSMNQN